MMKVRVQVAAAVAASFASADVHVSSLRMINEGDYRPVVPQHKPQVTKHEALVMGILTKPQTFVNNGSRFGIYSGYEVKALTSEPYISKGAFNALQQELDYEIQNIVRRQETELEQNEVTPLIQEIKRLQNQADIDQKELSIEKDQLRERTTQLAEAQDFVTELKQDLLTMTRNKDSLSTDLQAKITQLERQMEAQTQKMTTQQKEQKIESENNRKLINGYRIQVDALEQKNDSELQQQRDSSDALQKEHDSEMQQFRAEHAAMQDSHRTQIQESLQNLVKVGLKHHQFKFKRQKSRKEKLETLAQTKDKECESQINQLKTRLRAHLGSQIQELS